LKFLKDRQYIVYQTELVTHEKFAQVIAICKAPETEVAICMTEIEQVLGRFREPRDARILFLIGQITIRPATVVQ
jgi:hypothetical protein